MAGLVIKEDEKARGLRGYADAKWSIPPPPHKKNRQKLEVHDCMTIPRFMRETTQ